MDDTFYVSDTNYISTEGCFACNMNSGVGGGGRTLSSSSSSRGGGRRGRGSHRAPPRNSVSRRAGRQSGISGGYSSQYRTSSSRRRVRHRSKRHSHPSTTPVIKLTWAQAQKLSRPILYLQPSLVQEIFNQTVR